MYDSRNGIEHKCPCCSYEVEWDWGEVNGSAKFVKGDESFIRIGNNFDGIITFKTDKRKPVDWGLPDVKRVTLLGCPKCGAVSYKII